MPELIIKQYQHEVETWRRILSFLSEENINIKKRLSDILRGMEKSNDAMLDRIECFHNRLLKEDEIISFLSREVADQNKLLTPEVYEDGNILKAVISKQLKLSSAIETAEQEFNKLNFEFNSYLSKIM